MKKRFLTLAELALLRVEYPDSPTAVLATRLKMSVQKLYSYASRHKIKKSLAYLAGPHGGRLRRGDNISAAFRFEPGQPPHNKGKPFPVRGRSAATQFKPGHRGNKWVPAGSERITADGYRQRKVTETGYPPRGWKMVHVLLWEEHNGPVPAGCIVVFRNRDRADIRIDNLELITRAENCLRNGIHRYPPELRHAMRLAAKVERKLDEQRHQ